MEPALRERVWTSKSWWVRNTNFDTLSDITQEYEKARHWRGDPYLGLQASLAMTCWPRSGHPCLICGGYVARVLPYQHRLRIYHKAGRRRDKQCQMLAVMQDVPWVWTRKE